MVWSCVDVIPQPETESGLPALRPTRLLLRRAIPTHPQEFSWGRGNENWKAAAARLLGGVFFPIFRFSEEEPTPCANTSI